MRGEAAMLVLVLSFFEWALCSVLLLLLFAMIPPRHLVPTASRFLPSPITLSSLLDFQEVSLEVV